MVDIGARVVFDGGVNYIEDKISGERMHLTELQDMYGLNVWTKYGHTLVFRANTQHQEDSSGAISRRPHLLVHCLSHGNIQNAKLHELARPNVTSTRTLMAARRGHV